jgi:hypothetical protein
VYHLQFSLQAVSPEIFGYTLVFFFVTWSIALWRSQICFIPTLTYVGWVSASQQGRPGGSADGMNVMLVQDNPTVR